MTAIEEIESFPESRKEWNTYLANDIDEKHEVPTLLRLISGKMHALLKDLPAPEKPATKPFQQIVSTLQSHLNPKPLEIAERLRFYKRNQLEGENILTYCNFGGNLDEALRYRLICGTSKSRSDYLSKRT